MHGAPVWCIFVRENKKHHGASRCCVAVMLAHLQYHGAYGVAVSTEACGAFS